MYFPITIAVILIISFLFTLISKRMKLPPVIGLFIGGIVLGLPYVKDLILAGNGSIVLYLGDIGFLSLMFLAGLEVSWNVLSKEKKDSAFVAVFASVVPFLLGFAVFYAMGFPLLTALTVGVCMCITAEATKGIVLTELRKLKTRAGAIMLEAGIIDEIIGISIFILLGLFLAENFLLGEEFLLMVGGILAFFFGIMFHRSLGRENIEGLESFLVVFIMPFFFVSIGVRADMISLVLNPLFLAVVLTVAVLGKIFGTLLTKPFVKMRAKQLYLIGWSMNSRGGVELAIAFIALKAGMLTTDIYSSIVIMALATTLVFPFIITRMIRKDPKIMN